MDTRFLRAYLLFDLKAVPLELKKYLMLFDSLLSKSAATVDGRYLSDVEVANLMVKELMECTFGPGFLQLYKRYYSFYIEVCDLLPFLIVCCLLFRLPTTSFISFQNGRRSS